MQVGKGYALDYLFRRIFEDQGEQAYEGFFVFDADNLVDPQFVREMNKMFDTGEYAALTSYRNSKNFCDNWISAGYALWFLREARYLNRLPVSYTHLRAKCWSRRRRITACRS